MRRIALGKSGRTTTLLRFGCSGCVESMELKDSVTNLALSGAVA